MRLPAVLVAVPARDEQETIGEALASVTAALALAEEHGLVGRSHVEVSAHRCTDRTLDVGLAALAGVASAGVERDETSESVGQVRHAAVRRGLARLGSPPESTWVLSTDADTVVEPDWVRNVLREAEAARAVAVVGLADLDRWRGNEAAADAYAAVIAAKLRDPVGLHQHDHVYGANLAVRADAYLDCGGFPAHLHGEDQVLVDRLVERGHRVARTRNIRVRTSGRLVGRAEHGLAGHLRRLQLAVEAVPETDSA